MSEAKPPSRKRRLLGCCGSILFVPILGLVGVAAYEQESAPPGREGEGAERLVASVERAVDLAAWKRTGAIRWTFAGIHEHLWDRTRGFARIRAGQRVVLLDLAQAGATGRAWEGERELSGEELAGRLGWAWRQWCNDSFWLNPIAKMRDGGTRRLRCEPEGGRERFLVEYSSGGVTPGDRYLWEVGPEGLPVRWKMWVSILPVGGVDATWEGWETLATGAKVSTDHGLVLGLRLRLTEVAGAETLSELEPGSDPFAALVGGSTSK